MKKRWCKAKSLSWNKGVPMASRRGQISLNERFAHAACHWFAHAACHCFNSGTFLSTRNGQFLRAPFRQGKNRCKCDARKSLIGQDSRLNTYKVLQANVVRFVTIPGRGFRGIELVSRIFAVIQRSNRGIHLQKRTHNTQLIRNSYAKNLNNIPESRRNSWCNNSSEPIKQSIKIAHYDNRSRRLIRSINQSINEAPEEVRLSN